MTLLQLQKYKHLRKEWADLSARIAKASKEKPYLQELCALQEKQLTRVEEALMDIELFLSTTQDSEIRNIIRYYYMDGLTWAATASKLYGYPCADRPRLKLNRYFKKREKDFGESSAG